MEILKYHIYWRNVVFIGKHKVYFKWKIHVDLSINEKENPERNTNEMKQTKGTVLENKSELQT